MKLCICFREQDIDGKLGLLMTHRQSEQGQLIQQLLKEVNILNYCCWIFLAKEKTTTPGGPVVERSPGVWEVMGLIPSQAILKTLKWY